MTAKIPVLEELLRTLRITGYFPVVGMNGAIRAGGYKDEFGKWDRGRSRLPPQSADDKITWAGCCGTSCFGAFVDDKQRVRGLALASMGLRVVPEEIRNMTHLQLLNLGENKISEIPGWLGELPHLQLAQFYSNGTKVISRELFGIPRIEMSLEVYPWKEMRTDRYFADIANTSLEDPRDSRSRKLFIQIAEHALQLPPAELVARGRKAVLSFFESLQGGTTPLQEVRLLLLGNGGCGKTSLVRRVLGRGFDETEAQTDGINIDRWQLEVDGSSVRVNVWDFGGQEIMHATHQFFLSQRSLYVLVLDGRREEDPEYWLNLIESFGGASPVVVVLNKIDENPGFDINQKELQRKFPSITGFFRVSCKAAIGIDELIEGLRVGVRHVEITSTPWPKSWFLVKAKLEATQRPFMSHDEFRELCLSKDIQTATSQRGLVDFLNDLGLVVHFRDFRLDDTHVLDPRWLTEGVYAIINSPELASGRGVLLIDQFHDILSRDGRIERFPVEKHKYILAVMLKFELCYEVDRERILIPDLLPVQEPEFEFGDTPTVSLTLQYGFLPKSILPKFIVKRHAEIDGDLRWRSGVVLRSDTYHARAAVVADRAEKTITIKLSGDHLRDYLTLLRGTFSDIHAAFKSLVLSERIPIPGDGAATVGYEHLLLLERSGIAEVFPEGASHPYLVQDLLGTIAIPQARTEAEFISVLKRVISEAKSEESALQKANAFLKLQPSFMGVGVDLNAVIRSLMRKKDSK